MRETFLRRAVKGVAAVLGTSLVLASPSVLAEDVALDFDGLIGVLDGVSPEGADNVAAANAWRDLQSLDAREIPRLLSAIRSDRPRAANWIRAAVDAIAERTLRDGGELPRSQLEVFLADRSHSSRARRMAYEWLVRVDPSAEERWIPRMLEDPSVEFRRDAVARLLVLADRADEAQKRAASAASELYRFSLRGATDEDQVKRIVERLRAYGEEVDIATHYGFLRRWKILGPFDNTGVAGFDTEFSPERELSFDREYEGKAGSVLWQDYLSTDDYGVVDLNQGIAKEKEVLAYAYQEFTSAREQAVELRVATTNAFKAWVNGDLVYTRDEYHHGTKLDHYRAPARLRAGKNTILLKVCQNGQTESWTESWKFQIRVCNPAGIAVLSTTRDEATAAGAAPETEGTAATEGANG